MTVVRTSLIAPLICMLLLRETLCSSCVGEDSPCEYEVVTLAADAETPWGTTPAEDIAALEIPQHGTWRWGDSKDEIDVDQSGVEQAAWATYVHDPDTIEYSEHVGGGRGVTCNGPMVSVDGTLTITDEQDAVILSVPVTVERQDMSTARRRSTPRSACSRTSCTRRRCSTYRRCLAPSCGSTACGCGPSSTTTASPCGPRRPATAWSRSSACSSPTSSLVPSRRSDTAVRRRVSPRHGAHRGEPPPMLQTGPYG